MKDFEEVLRLLMAAGMTLKLKKCHFFFDSIDYLGHVIDIGMLGKLHVSKTTTEAIESLQYTKDVSQMRSHLGLCKVYRHFVPGFQKIAAPLNRKLRSGNHQNLSWTIKNVER